MSLRFQPMCANDEIKTVSVSQHRHAPKEGARKIFWLLLYNVSKPYSCVRDIL